jgi:hypothetical protein
MDSGIDHGIALDGEGVKLAGPGITGGNLDVVALMLDGLDGRTGGDFAI